MHNSIIDVMVNNKLTPALADLRKRIEAVACITPLAKLIADVAAQHGVSAEALRAAMSPYLGNPS